MLVWSEDTWQYITRKAIIIYELKIEAAIVNEEQNEYLEHFLGQIELFEKLLLEPYNPNFSSILIVVENFAKLNKTCYDGYVRNL